MTVRVLFEIRDTDPESSLSKLLHEVTTEFPQHSPQWDRLIGQLMIFRGTQMLESAAIREHDQWMNEARKTRAAATRAARKR